ncbi:beta-galactosidase trimerization domain-containing protein [Spirosoma sp. BT702]|uniref:Beta-galactosidase trimerization domain-containing protein n=1 Tax=Spirosoma profusum TaxID=2771354 RepID=A0A926XZI7_9BACT|nr:beta-galactosidase trimerization domain-containing protein [Spirosoma profusum]MBD2703156.1 beta-galactosidase trimerization domain-containing protein [Spirosoma profusum]
MERRDFIKTSGLISGAYALSGMSVLANSSISSTNVAPTDTYWLDGPMRWAQLAFVERDPGHYDPDFWLNYFKRIHADGALLSAGGIVAFYPTKIPLHHRSDFMGNSDTLGYLVEGCRKQSMKVMLRTDPHAARQNVYDAHPDWIAVTADGQKRRHWANPDLWVTCALGPYNFEFMPQINAEIMERFGPEGIFSNRWAGHDICYCEHCKRNFKTYAALDIPPKADKLDPTYRKWAEWRMKRLREVWALWDSGIRKQKPTSRFIPNGFPDKIMTGREADLFFADQQARRGLIPPWSNGKGAKELRSTLGLKPLIGIFSVGIEEEFRWKDSVQSDAEIRIWVAEGTANGMRPCFVKFGGDIFDKRWMESVATLYEGYHKNEKYLRNTAPMARVGLVYSEQTERNYGGKPWQQKSGDHLDGFYHNLVENRVPFDMVNDRLLTPDDLKRFKLLILPNIAALSDAQCKQLQAFVERGGSLVATFETSLYDEEGKQRSDFGLAGLFGVLYSQKVEGPMRNSYLRLQPNPDSQTQLILRGLGDTPRIINAIYKVNVTPTATFPSPVTLIPTYPDLPMEDVYPRVAQTDTRELYLRQVGKGRVAYIPGDLDRSFWQLLSVDHGQLLSNVVNWALDEEPVASVTGPGVIDVTVWRQDKSMTVHLVNLTNPMMMKGPFRELIPVEAGVSVQVPTGANVTGVSLLMSGQKPKFERNGNRITVVVPKILDHEIVALDLA